MIYAVTTGEPVLDWLSQAGSVGVLAFLVVAFMRGWLVSGTECQRVRDERDKALDLVYKQAEVAQRALEVGEKK